MPISFDNSYISESRFSMSLARASAYRTTISSAVESTLSVGIFWTSAKSAESNIFAVTFLLSALVFTSFLSILNSIVPPSIAV